MQHMHQSDAQIPPSIESLTPPIQRYRESGNHSCQDEKYAISHLGLNSCNWHRCTIQVRHALEGQRMEKPTSESAISVIETDFKPAVAVLRQKFDVFSASDLDGFAGELARLMREGTAAEAFHARNVKKCIDCDHWNYWRSFRPFRF